MEIKFSLLPDKFLVLLQASNGLGLRTATFGRHLVRGNV